MAKIYTIFYKTFYLKNVNRGQFFSEMIRLRVLSVNVTFHLVTAERSLSGMSASLICRYFTECAPSQNLSQVIKKNFTPFQLQQLPKFQEFLIHELNFSFSAFSKIMEGNNGILLNYHLSSVKNRIYYLQSTYLIKNQHMKSILLCHPKWLIRPKEDIDDLLYCFLDNQVSLTDLGTALSRNPSVLLFSAVQLSQKMEVFDENFFTKREKREILLNSADVLNKPVELLRRIYSYLKQTFNMTHEEMMKSCAFSYSFRHLFCRLEFMRRRGLYIGRDKRGIFPSNKQPHPQKIIGSSENIFLNQVALSTADEFQDFCKSLPPSILQELDLYDNFETFCEEDGKEELGDVYTGEEEENEGRSFSWAYLKSKYD